MKFPLFIAHGEGVFTMLLFVLPASLTGVVFLITSFVSVCREKKGFKKRASIFAIGGAGLLTAAYFAMRVSTGIARVF